MGNRIIYVPAKARPFITEWTVAGDATARTVTLPFYNSGSVNCNIDWGDGSPLSYCNAYNDADRIHTYSSNGTYRIAITGIMDAWSFNNGGDKLKIVKVISWGGGNRMRGFTYLTGGFYGCSNLTSLPANESIPRRLGGCTNFQNTFNGCSKLTALSEVLFKLHTNVTASAFQNCFYGCTLLATVPANLFKYNTGVSGNGFNSCFTNCTSLTSISGDIFKYNVSVSSGGFTYAFYGSGLTGAIPTDLFRNQSALTTTAFESCFYNCTLITEIPATLFDACTLITTAAFNACFKGCTGINVSIPADLFKFNVSTSTTSFAETFSGCTNIPGNIPSGLFDHTGSVTTFQYTFYNCRKITGIPAGLFDHAGSGITTFGFYFTFTYGYLIASIPTDLFKYNTAVSSYGFYSCFQYCTTIPAIPAGLFDTCVSVSSFGFKLTFNSTTGMNTALPDGLFHHCTSVSSEGFYGTFNLSKVPGIIPGSTFGNNTNLTTNAFYSCFEEATEITEIGAGLFDGTTAISSGGVERAFRKCTKLVTLPNDLFKYVTSCTGFSATFEFGVFTTIPSGWFDYITTVNATFVNIFASNTALTTVPSELFRLTTSSLNYSTVFYGCLKLQMVADLFYRSGEESTRFLNQSPQFSGFMYRTSFTGSQGSAPNLWTCSLGTGSWPATFSIIPFGGAGNSATSISNYSDLPLTMTINVAPATDWAVGDTITGQTSAKTCITVLKRSSTTYWVNNKSGAFTNGEVIGVTGNAAKLADQNSGAPAFSGTNGWRDV